jgi:hypothetical protein
MNVEKGRQTVTCVQSITDQVRNTLAVAVVLGVAEKDLNLLKIFFQGLALLGRVAKVLKVMAQHSAEFITQLADKALSQLRFRAHPLVPTQRLFLDSYVQSSPLDCDWEETRAEASRFCPSRQRSHVLDPISIPSEGRFG